MQRLFLVFNVLLVVILPLTLQHETDIISDEVDCPTWMYAVNSSNGTSHCICGVPHNHEIICDSIRKEVKIIDGLVMSYDEETNKVIAGYTLFGLTKKSTDKMDEVYRNVPLNKTLLKDMCYRFHREGQLCGACRKDHFPQIYTFDFSCKRCSNSGNGWILLILLTFGPITLFYIFTLLFKFNANLPNIHAHVLVAHLIYSPQILRLYSVQYNRDIVEKLVAFTYGIWNFDFLSAFHTKLCTPLTTLQALSLGYVAPCYALLLIIITYAIIELHSRGCKIVVLLSNLFRKCARHLNIPKNDRSSIIDVFATFLLLSYNRLLSTHIDLLMYVEPFDHSGTKIGKYLYYDPTTEYFGKEHRPYGILALSIFLFCSLIPLLLLLFYPMKCFQRCLNRFKLNWYGLCIFVDSFAGCYKDGTEPGTRDCRYFAALFLLLRILTYLTLYTLPPTCAGTINAIIIVLFMTLFVACQPYKDKYAAYNWITTIMLALSSAVYVALLGVSLSQIKTLSYTKFSSWVLFVLVFIPQLYISTVTLKWLSSICVARGRNSELTPLLTN